MPLRVAIAVNHFFPSIGGAEKVTETIAEFLSKYHNVVVFTRRTSDRTKRKIPYTITEYVPGDFATFERRLSNYKPDVVLIYSDVFDFFRQLAIRQNPFKLILALCGANWLYSHPNYVNLILRNITNIHRIICHSTRERDYKICSHDYVAPKTVIIPNGIWLNEFDGESKTKKELNPKIADKKWILNVSNFFPGKGQEHLIRILANLPDKDFVYLQIASDIKFDIGEILEHKWKKASVSLKKSGVTVKLLKNISREDVISYFKNSNVFAFTSEKEVAPLVLLESMASSLPWISTNVGNAQDLEGGINITALKDSRFHSVFDERVMKLFCEGIQKLLNTPKIAESGRRQIERELNWDRILPEYLNVIEQ